MQTQKTAQSKEASTTLIDRLFSAGAHFGYSRSRRHPSVAPYIFGTKNRTEIFDLEKTSELVKKAVETIEQYGKEKKMVLFVGGKSEAQKSIRSVAESLGMPFVAGRWIGGTLTNYPEIKKRMLRLEMLREGREKGEFQKKYTKKERLLIDREIARLEERFAGILPMKDMLPSLMVVVDTAHEEIAVKEANSKNIPVVGIGSSDCDLTLAKVSIVANDNSQSVISLLLEELKAGYKRGLQHEPQNEKKEDEKKVKISA